MSFFSEIFSSSNQSVDTVKVDLGSSVLSATGLSRSALATLFRQDGLFGHESDLSPVEQAIVQSRLGPIAGLRTRPFQPHHRLLSDGDRSRLQRKRAESGNADGR